MAKGEQGREAPGRLFLVVGPSGAGKDSLIAAAKAAFAKRADVVFPRRIITRTSDPQSEDHDSVAETEFDRLREDGAFFLHWRAHRLRYALPASVAEDLAAGTTVVSNVSRTVIAEAQAKHARTTVIFVTASQPVLEQRLHSRGREDQQAVRHRLARGTEVPAADSLLTVINDGRLEDAVARFLSLLAPVEAP